MTPTLIDRYVWTALRRLPEEQRADIDRELRSTIDDTVEARVEAGEARDAAIDAALRELGDPDLLADRYAGRRHVLIGPELYPAWRRLLVMLLSVVLPIAAAGIALGRLIAGDGVGEVIGGTILAAMNVALHMCFWVTLVFALIERSETTRGSVRSPGLRREWTPERLPDYQPGRMGRGELAMLLVLPVLVGAALIWQHFASWVRVDGEPVPILEPSNWSFWWPYLIGLCVLEGAYAFWIYQRGRYSTSAAVVNTVLQVAFVVPAVWLLATDRFLNPEFIAAIDWGSPSADPVRVTTLVLIVSIVAIGVWDVVDGFLKAWRARRGEPAVVPGTRVGRC